MRVRTWPISSAPMAHRSGFTDNDKETVKKANDAYIRRTRHDTKKRITNMYEEWCIHDATIYIMVRSTSYKKNCEKPGYAYDYVAQVPTDRCQVLGYQLSYFQYEYYIAQTAERKSVRGITVRNMEATYEYNEYSGDISVVRKKQDRPQERLVETIIARGPGYDSQESWLTYDM